MVARRQLFVLRRPRFETHASGPPVASSAGGADGSLSTRARALMGRSLRALQRRAGSVERRRSDRRAHRRGAPAKRHHGLLPWQGESTPFIQTGSDGRPGTPTISLAPPERRVAQIRDRVLPIGATINVTVVDDGTRVPLYTETPGFVGRQSPVGTRHHATSECHARADQCVRPQLPRPRLRRGRARPRRVCKPLGVVLIAAVASITRRLSWSSIKQVNCG